MLGLWGAWGEAKQRRGEERSESPLKEEGLRRWRTDRDLNEQRRLQILRDPSRRHNSGKVPEEEPAWCSRDTRKEVQKRRLGQHGVCSLIRELGFILNIMEL